MTPVVRFARATPCELPALVDTLGWVTHRVGVEPVVAPRQFRQAGPYVLSWDGRSLGLFLALGKEDWSVIGEECSTTLGGQGTLVVTRRSEAGVEIRAWLFADELEPEFGTLHHLVSEHPEDEAMLWTILRGMYESITRPDLPSPELENLARRECPAQLVLEAQAPSDPEARCFVSAWLVATLVNRGAKPIVLVAPGDGSSRARRTPRTWFTILRGRRRVAPTQSLASCSLMNQLTSQDLVELDPGEARVLHGLWTDGRLERPGTYEVRLNYRNEPDMPRDDDAEQDPALLARVRASLPCDIVSNPVWIELAKEDVEAWRNLEGAARRHVQAGSRRKRASARRDGAPHR